MATKPDTHIPDNSLNHSDRPAPGISQEEHVTVSTQPRQRVIAPPATTRRLQQDPGLPPNEARTGEPVIAIRA